MFLILFESLKRVGMSERVHYYKPATKKELGKS